MCCYFEQKKKKEEVSILLNDPQRKHCVYTVNGQLIPLIVTSSSQPKFNNEPVKRKTNNTMRLFSEKKTHNKYA